MFGKKRLSYRDFKKIATRASTAVLMLGMGDVTLTTMQALRLGLTSDKPHQKDAILLLLAKAALTAQSETRVTRSEYDSFRQETLFGSKVSDNDAVLQFLDRVYMAAQITSHGDRKRDDQMITDNIKKAMQKVYPPRAGESDPDEED